MLTAGAGWREPVPPAARGECESGLGGSKGRLGEAMGGSGAIRSAVKTAGSPAFPGKGDKPSWQVSRFQL